MDISDSKYGYRPKSRLHLKVVHSDRPLVLTDPVSAKEAGAHPHSKRPARRPGRIKTRLLGFEYPVGAVDPVISNVRAAPKAVRVSRPVGWIIIARGPGQGEVFALPAGKSQIGRDDDQTIQLNFGDDAISRTNHAAIVYDETDHTFVLGHGGKSNIVRLNGKPVLSTVALGSGDEIRIGDTVMLFKALCSKEFNWAPQNEGQENE